MDSEHAQALEEATRDLERASTASEYVSELIDRLRSRVASPEATVRVSVWRAEYNTKTLVCANCTENDPDHVRELRFGQGLVGWAAQHRQPVNVLVRREDERLVDGTLVREQYIAFFDNKDDTQAELSIPMMYQGRLVGVVDVETSAVEQFSKEQEGLVRFWSALAGQAIHQQELRDFYQEIIRQTNLGELLRTVARRAGNFLEAPYAAIFLWDEHAQALRLKESSNPIKDRAGKLISPGALCYRQEGMGLTRWAFDNKMWLNLKQVQALEDPDDREWDELRGQAEQQLQTRWKAPIRLQESRPPGRLRQWRARKPLTGENVTLEQPTWSNEHMEGDPTDDPRAVLIVPIETPVLEEQALGVMRFSRKAGDRVFGQYELDLLQMIAHQCAQFISRYVRDEALRRQHLLATEIVVREPAGSSHNPHPSIQEALADLRSSIKCDLVLVRVRAGRELLLLASFPERLGADANGPDWVIPHVAYEGRGGSGHAAQTKVPVFIDNENHPVIAEIRQEFDPASPEARFALRIKSEIAVPLLAKQPGTEEPEVVGTLTAISFSPSSHIIERQRDGWRFTETGIQLRHRHALLSQAEWLGPSLKVLCQQAGERRYSASMLAALEELIHLLERGGDLSHFPTIVARVASHPEALGLPQVMVAEVARGEGPGGRLLLRGLPWSAWGVTSLAEQQNTRSRTLKQCLQDLQLNRLAGPPKTSLAKRWESFSASLPSLSEEPCVVAQEAAEVGPVRYRVELAKNGDPWDQFLSACARVFGAENAARVERHLSVAIVPIRSASGTSGCERVFIVTQVRFERAADSSGRLICDPIQTDLVRILYEGLAPLASIALEVPHIIELHAANRFLIERFPEVIHRFMRPVVGLHLVIDQILDNLRTGCPDPDLPKLVSYYQRLLKTTSSTVRVTVGSGELCDPKLFHPCSVDELIEDLVVVFDAFCRANSVRFIAPEKPVGLKINCEKGFIQIALWVLLDNARQALTCRQSTPPEAYVRLEVQRRITDHENWVDFLVEDNGIPLPPAFNLEAKPELKSAWKGFGIGLIAARKIACEHNGRITVSPAGAPKRFGLVIPAAVV